MEKYSQDLNEIEIDDYSNRSINENINIEYKRELIDTQMLEIKNIKPVIIKKSQRGRKTKNPFPKDPRCEICLKYENESSLNGIESLISCSYCKAILHPSCYHISIDKRDYKNFICERCKDALIKHNPIESYKCLICTESNGILKKNNKTGEFYHFLCLTFIQDLYDQKDHEENIIKDNIRKWRYKSSCRYCGEKLNKEKAVIKCCKTKCKEFYHIPCAIEKETIFNIDYLYKYFNINKHKSCPFYCSYHNKRLLAGYKQLLNFYNSLTNNNIINDSTQMQTEESIFTDSSLEDCKSMISYKNNNINDSFDENYYSKFNGNCHFFNDSYIPSFGSHLFNYHITEPILAESLNYLSNVRQKTITFNNKYGNNIMDLNFDQISDDFKRNNFYEGNTFDDFENISKDQVLNNYIYNI